MAAEGLFKDEHEEQSRENIRQDLDAFLRNRAEIIRIMQEFADELDEVHKNVKITKVVTGSTGIAGTILCITGLALAIPTAGLSMFLTIGGGVLAAASGTAHLGSDIAERLITKSRLDKLNELCQADEASIFRLNDYLKKENERLKNTISENIVRETTSSFIGEISSLSALTCSIVRISQAATLTVSTIRFIGMASAVLSAVTLPIQIIDLAANGHALGKKQISETSLKLRQLADLLNAQAANMRTHIENQRILLNF